MFAVTGTWAMSPAMREGQSALLPGLVEGVRRNDGFVRGYWSEDVDDPSLNVTYIVFDTLAQAQAFRQAVLANAPAQAEAGVARGELRIVRVVADA